MLLFAPLKCSMYFLECCLGANVHYILTFADRRPPEACDVRAVKVYSWLCTVGEGRKMYSVLIVHVFKVCIVLSQGAVWCSQHMNTYCRGVPGCILMGVHLVTCWKYIGSQMLRNKRCNEAWKWKMFFIAFLVMAQYWCLHYHKLSNFIVDQG